MDGGLDADEQALVARVAERRDEIVALACELIAFDTTSRAQADEPAREEVALQQALAERLRAAGAEIDLWEPAPEDVTDHPLSIQGIAFDGRPQLAATLRGSGGGRSRVWLREWRGASFLRARVLPREAAIARRT